MRLRKKGRKIYKTKEKNYYGKTPVGKFFSAALSILLLGGLGFLGYSVAEPIINYTRKTGDNEVSSSEIESSAVQTEASDTTSAAVSVQENVNIEQYRAASLTTDALTNIESLRSALTKVTADFGVEYISVPLKISGGEIYYASTVNEAQLCGAVKSSLTLSEITSEIRAAGFKPTAEISLLKDNLMPQTYPETGYTTADDGSRWIDDSAENGGKPWISPFSDAALMYLGAIGDEIASADFDKAICSDVVFPPFRESDLELLGDEVKSNERYLALTSAANLMYSKLINGGTAMMLEISAVDLLQGNGEVIQPMLLDVNTLVLNVNFDEMGNVVTAPGTVYEFTGTASENASKIIGLVQHKLSDYNVVVRFSGQNTDQSELLKAKEVIAEFGYTSYIIG